MPFSAPNPKPKSAFLGIFLDLVDLGGPGKAEEMDTDVDETHGHFSMRIP
jgi:hypothetical protein